MAYTEADIARNAEWWSAQREKRRPEYEARIARWRAELADPATDLRNSIEACLAGARAHPQFSEVVRHLEAALIASTQEKSS